MSAIEDEIKRIADEEAQKALEEVADELLNKMVSETEKQLKNYYTFPKGIWYNRTGQFETAYGKEYRSSGKGQTMQVTVGINFDCLPYYPIHAKSVTEDDIYGWNLEGHHGSNGDSENILEHMNDFADRLAGV